MLLLLGVFCTINGFGIENVTSSNNWGVEAGAYGCWIWGWRLPAPHVSVSAFRAGVGVNNPQTTPKNAFWRGFSLFGENYYFPYFCMKWGWILNFLSSSPQELSLFFHSTHLLHSTAYRSWLFLICRLIPVVLSGFGLFWVFFFSFVFMWEIHKTAQQK